MKSGSNFPNGSSESIYGDDDELVAFPEPAHAFSPARSVTTGTPRRGVGEYPIGDNPRSGNSILLLIDGLLASRDPEIGGDAHRVSNKSPIFIPVSDPEVLRISCGPGRSDYPACSDVMR
jgi:hypothetical protein